MLCMPMPRPAFLLVLLASCSGEAQPTQGPAALPVVVHDFGVIPHGESRVFDYALPKRHLPGERQWVPLRAHIDCSCGQAQLLLRHRNGQERLLDGRPDPDQAIGADEELFVRLTLNTLTKDAVDLPQVTSRGYVLLQPVGDRDGSQRVSWPFLVQFGIDAPVVLQPYAALDFGKVPTCLQPQLVLRLAGDSNHPNVRFGPVASSEQSLVAELSEAAGQQVLTVRCVPQGTAPDELGNQSAVLAVHTTIPGYVLHIGAKWKVVPELAAAPLAKLSFRTDRTKPQSEAEASGQFVLVTDHHPARAPEFEVRSLTDSDGHDASAQFAVQLQPVPGSLRQQRLLVRSLAGPASHFRGTILLGKANLTEPTLPIELVVFHRP